MITGVGALINTRDLAFQDIVEVGMCPIVFLFVYHPFFCPLGTLECFGENQNKTCVT